MKRLSLLLKKEWSDIGSQKIFVLVTIFSPFLLFFIFFLIWSSDITSPIEVTNSAGAAGEEFIQAMEDIKTPFGTNYIQVIQKDPSILISRSPSDYLIVVETPKDFQQVDGNARKYHVIAHYGAEQQNTIKNFINRLHMAQTEYLIKNNYGFTPVWGSIP